MVIESIILFVIVYKTNACTDWLTMPQLNDNQIRGLIYLNVSVSGQATIFVTRAEGWWFQSRPSILLMLAFFIAQVASSLISLYGFGGYPNDGESDFEGCGWQYLILGWIWSILWFLFMDPIKFLVYWASDKLYAVGPVRRTRKVFGHPVYGRHGRRPFSIFSPWPNLAMEPPSPEDVADVAASMRRASLDLVEEPWQLDEEMSQIKKRKKKKNSELLASSDSDDAGKLKPSHHHHARKHEEHSDDSSEASYDSYSEGSSDSEAEKGKSKS